MRNPRFMASKTTLQDPHGLAFSRANPPVDHHYDDDKKGVAPPGSAAIDDGMDAKSKLTTVLPAPHLLAVPKATRSAFYTPVSETQTDRTRQISGSIV
jgi:hypothetical protein